MRSIRSDHWPAWAGGAAIVTALLVSWLFEHNRARDRQVAREAEADVVQALQTLPADHPIIRRHGRFERLEGAGFERSPQGLGRSGIPLLMSRNAVFADSEAHLTIQVYGGRNLSVGPFHLYPNDASASDMQTTIRDDKIWFTRGTETTSGSLSVAVYHPRCPAR